MKRRAHNSFTIALAAATCLLAIGCRSSASNFEAFMGARIPAHVRILKMDGNWGGDPWRCWELSPVDDELKRKLIAGWSLVPNPKAFHGVASGDRIYCQYDDLTESYSATSDSYRAVGIDAVKDKMVVYFYNG